MYPRPRGQICFGRFLVAGWKYAYNMLISKHFKFCYVAQKYFYSIYANEIYHFFWSVWCKVLLGELNMNLIVWEGGKVIIFQRKKFYKKFKLSVVALIIQKTIWLISLGATGQEASGDTIFFCVLTSLFTDTLSPHFLSLVWGNPFFLSPNIIFEWPHNVL